MKKTRQSRDGTAGGDSLPRFVGRFLCRIGIHKWDYTSPKNYLSATLEYRTCQRCKHDANQYRKRGSREKWTQVPF